MKQRKAGKSTTVWLVIDVIDQFLEIYHLVINDNQRLCCVVIDVIDGLNMYV